MEWLLLAAFGIMWAAFLLPAGAERRPTQDVGQDFERRMELLAQAEVARHERTVDRHPPQGHAVPRTRRAAAGRARERRRQVFVFLLESIGLTFLIGLVPPLRALWYVDGGVRGLLVVYVWLLLSIKHRESAVPHARPRRGAGPRPAARRRRRRATWRRAAAARASDVQRPRHARRGRPRARGRAPPARPPRAPDGAAMDLDDLDADIHARFDATDRRSGAGPARRPPLDPRLRERDPRRPPGRVRPRRTS